MKTIIIIIAAALWSLQIQAQQYYLKETRQETTTESGTSTQRLNATFEDGYISLEEYTITVRSERRPERVYTLDFEPIETDEGLYFTATFEGREFECWYDLVNGWLLVRRGGYLIYYHFEKVY